MNPQKVLSINSSVYLDIISTIGKWKVIACRDLLKYLQFKISYKTLQSKIKQLEEKTQQLEGEPKSN